MIQNGFSYAAFLIFFASIVIYAENKSKSKFFKYVPALVIIYFGAMLLGTFGVWVKNDSTTAAYKAIKDSLLPAMIFLMLLRCDLRQIVKLGPKMLIAFFTATLSIMVGFVVAYGIFKGSFPEGTWKALAALCGSWIGGTGNMVAVQGALNIGDSQMGYTLLMDSINASVWIMVLLWGVSFAPKFNKWTKADTSVIDNIGAELAKTQAKVSKEVSFPDLMILLGLSLFVSAASTYLGTFMPQSMFLSGTTWTVMIATLFGVICAMSPIAKIPGAAPLSNVMLYTIVSLIASRGNFAELGQAPIFVAAGFVILAVHALVTIILAKFMKLDLFTCAIASLANIGGVASAPILAAAYSEALVPIGVVMALMGYVMGTGCALIVGKILSIM